MTTDDRRQTTDDKWMIDMTDYPTMTDLALRLSTFDLRLHPFLKNKHLLPFF